MPVARAFSQFLNLANIAEQHHRVRRSLVGAQPGRQPAQGLAGRGLPRLLQGETDPEALYHAACELDIELVLTAHPTETQRRTMLQKYNRIARLLDGRDRLDLTPTKPRRSPPACAGRSSVPGRATRSAAAGPRRWTRRAGAWR